MSDGPFRNLKLNTRWKRFGDQVLEATDGATCCEVAADALVREVLEEESARALLKALHQHSQERQMDLDPVAGAEQLFRGYNGSSFIDDLKKRYLHALSKAEVRGDAWTVSLEAAVRERLRQVGCRLEEECIRSCERGEVSRGDVKRFAASLQRSIDGVEVSGVVGALATQNVTAFKVSKARNKGLEDGPLLSIP